MEAMLRISVIELWSLVMEGLSYGEWKELNKSIGALE